MCLTKHRNTFGFTIVELLIVLVIIGILATIVAIAYIGIQPRAIGASLTSDLLGADNQLKIYQVDHNAFPTSNDCSGGTTPAPPKICLKSSSDNSFSAYTANNLASPQTYSLQAFRGTTTYVITSTSSPTLVTTAPPTLTSPTSASVNASGATLGATITSDGGSSITAEGICWGTTPTPTSNCTATGGTGTGVFTLAVSGLTSVTTYYYRGYATNDAGTAYSPDGTFTTTTCFLAGTMISTPKGDVAIERLRVGDTVWSWNGKERVANVIRKTFVHETFGYYKLTTVFESLLVTGAHPLLTPNGYKSVENITFGDQLLTRYGSQTVMSKAYIPAQATVYNFELDEPHNYFANGFIVHNFYAV